MVTKEHLDALKQNTDKKPLYVPATIYGVCLDKILTTYNVPFNRKGRTGRQDEEIKTEWSEKIEKMTGRSYPWLCLVLWYTPYDPDELFALLADAVKNDPDFAPIVERATPRPWKPDPNWVE